MMVAENKGSVKTGRIKKKDAKKTRKSAETNQYAVPSLAETNQFAVISRSKKPFALLRTLFAVIPVPVPVILALLAVISHYLEPLVHNVTVSAFLFQ